MNVKVGRYQNPGNVGGWQGFVEDAEKTWIVFIDAQGRPHLFAHRDENGGCIGPAALVMDRESCIKAQEEAELLDPGPEES